MPHAFSLLCNAFYFKGSGHKSKPKFVNDLLDAAGCQYPITDASQATRFFNGKGSHELPVSVFEGFPNRTVDVDSLTSFFLKLIDKVTEAYASTDAVLKTLALKLNLARHEQLEPLIVARACAIFFQALIAEENQDLDIQQCYDKLLNGVNVDEILNSYPLIHGDKAIVSTPPALQKYVLNTWTQFEHTWVIQNCGEIIWRNRFLRLISSESDRLRRLDDSSDIPIPLTPPRAFAKLKATFQTRGYEGKETTHWIMVDDTGADCFPNMSTDFNVQATIKFVPTEKERQPNA